MKVFKFLTGTTLVGMIAVLAFNITYEKVSATEMEKAKEKEKTKIVYKTIIDTSTDNLEEKKEELNEDENKQPKLNVISNNFIFIGDDRLLSLKHSSENFDVDSITFINNKKATCDWMRNSGLSELNDILYATDLSYNIIFNPSINDLENIERYIDFFNNLATQHPNHNIFVLDVFPLDEVKLENIKEEKDKINLLSFDKEILEHNIFNDKNLNECDYNEVNNDSIYKFNIKLKKSLNSNVHIIYAGQQLVCSEFETTDGYYLTDNTATELLNFIYNHIKALEKQ